MAKYIIAVIVAYKPNKKDFCTLLKAMRPQVASVIVVDNSSGEYSLCELASSYGIDIELLQMSSNVGIAAAQNAGIERAMELGADFVLLSDQDSVPSAGMVADLLTVLLSPSQSSFTLPVAAVGPATVDRRTGRKSFFITKRRGLPHRWRKPLVSHDWTSSVEVEFLIASGTLIPIEVIKHIGSMRSDFFIDHVDTEWCFRAKVAGYRLLGVPAATLEHQLGDTIKRIWFFGHRDVMYHSPLRDYYMFRNTLLMIRRTPMYIVWRLYFLWRLIQFAVYFLGFAHQRVLRLRRMLLGLVHGMGGRGGRLEESSGRLVDLPKSQLEP